MKIICSDNISWLKQQQDNSIDLIITSPPYNLQNKGGEFKIMSYKDDYENEEYEKMQIEFLNQCYRVLKPLGAMFYNHKNRYENCKVITPYQWILKTKFNINQEIIWNRKSAVDFNRQRFCPLDEKVFWLYKEKTFITKKGASCFTNIWEINRPKPSENFGHNATFPHELIYRIINCLDVDYTQLTLLDPYLGTGTTLWVGKKFNFKEMYGIELQQKWCDIAEIKINTYLSYEEDIPIPKKKYDITRFKKQPSLFDLLEEGE